MVTPSAANRRYVHTRVTWEEPQRFWGVQRSQLSRPRTTDACCHGGCGSQRALQLYADVSSEWIWVQKTTILIDNRRFLVVYITRCISHTIKYTVTSVLLAAAGIAGGVASMDGFLQVDSVIGHVAARFCQLTGTWFW